SPAAVVLGTRRRRATGLRGACADSFARPRNPRAAPTQSARRGRARADATPDAASRSADDRVVAGRGDGDDVAAVADVPPGRSERDGWIAREVVAADVVAAGHGAGDRHRRPFTLCEQRL